MSLPDPAEACGGVFFIRQSGHEWGKDLICRRGMKEHGDDTTAVKPLIMLDETNGVLYNNDRHPGVRDSLSVFPTFHKMEPGSNGRYAMPPF